MKKILIVVLSILSIVFISSTVFLACSRTNLNLSTESERFIITENSEPVLKLKYSDQGENIFVYHLGKIENVPIAYGPGIEHDGKNSFDISYSKNQLTEATVTQSKATALESTVTVLTEESISFEDDQGLTANVSIAPVVGVGASISATHNVKKALSQAQSVNKSTSTTYSDVYEIAQVFSDGTSETLNFKLGKNRTPGFYRLTLFAQCDLLAFAVYNSVEKTYSVNFDFSCNPASLFYAVEFSQTRSFNPIDDLSKITFDTNILKDSGLFNFRWFFNINYQLNGGKMDTIQDVYTPDHIELLTPTKNFFEFAGWYLDSDLTKIAKQSEILQSPSDLTLYASWKPQTWTLYLKEDKKIIHGRNDAGTYGFYYLLDPNYLKAYSAAGYRMKITLNYNIIRFDGDFSKGTAKICILNAVNSSQVDLSGVALASEPISTLEARVIYRGSLSAEIDPSELLVNRLAMVFTCENDDVLGLVLTSAADWYTVLGDSHLIIEFIK